MDFTKLGEFGASIQTFDKKKYQEELVKNWEEIIAIYAKKIEGKIEQAKYDEGVKKSIDADKIILDNYRQLKEKPELWDFVTDMNLKANIATILQEIYGENRTAIVAPEEQRYDTVKRNFKNNPSIHKFASDKSVHDLDSQTIDALAHISFDQMRETLMTTAGLDYVPRQMIGKDNNQLDIIKDEQGRTIIQPMYSVNNGMSSKGYIDRIEYYYQQQQNVNSSMKL